MALTAKSLFLYGIEITPLNSSLDFRAISGGPILRATLTLGFYSLSDLMIEIARAMKEVDPNGTYTATSDRTVNGGTENRTSITTSRPYLDLLFASGPRVASSCAFLIGFDGIDYTGATTYTGSGSCGTTLTSTLVGYNYLGTDKKRKVFGSLNISTSGQKEAIVFQIQKFFQVQFKYEPTQKVEDEWVPFMTWAIQQKPLDFTPEITDPNTFYNCTLEKTSADGKGLAYDFKEMLPQFPFLYDTGTLTFRFKEV